MVYKIKRKSDGMYSTGGVSPNWTKTGKCFTTRGGLTLHVKKFKSWRYNGKSPYAPLSDYEIEVSDLSVTGYLRMEEEFQGD